MVTTTPAPTRMPWAIPAEAMAEWLRLAEQIDGIGAVPCRTSDPDAWWPDRREIDELPARMALDACSVCDARAACLDYALAAGEREGIWGATLPQDREKLSRAPVARPQHDHREYSPGCPDCRRSHARRVADWRKRREYAETTRSA